MCITSYRAKNYYGYNTKFPLSGTNALIMARRGFYLSLFLVFSIAAAAPTKHVERARHSSQTEKAIAAITPKYPVEDMQLMQPHYITLEDFESLLRRAGELFRPNAYLVDDTTTTPSQQNNDRKSSVTAASVPAPYQQIQSPAVQPFNFYMPLFEFQHSKSDMKSKHMQFIAPPPVPSKAANTINYYATKPKKLPKKFNADTKQVNLKWLNTFEKEALSDASGQLPKAVYMLNDERNRINFDDSFFGVDMQVKIPNNQPHKEDHSYSAGARGQDEFLNQGEDGGEDDLVAAAAGQLEQSVSQV
ncbi:uncharacterized protein LOC105216056 [Zeugodacus cucurbitae]|uniref:uncharacterized protein LOC105216056 n=1 Tax=Zeugodacus cucurbitae TaxID=28588 RepID=UPI0023D9605B|nr:uncharacterized protein LOC105216056 [Zeugodacus cucurbitae]